MYFSFYLLFDRTAEINFGVKDRGMQQADQTVLSLRPGGGRGRLGGGPRFESSSSSTSSSSSSAFAFGTFSSDLPLLRPHGGAPSSFFIKV